MGQDAASSATSKIDLKGLARVPDMADFTTANKASWLWTMLIMQPDEAQRHT